MELLAQELLDAIIDHVPSPHAHSCSLVARRWRKRGQRRVFSDLKLVFSCEDDLIRWRKDIPQDPDGIPSYIRDVQFRGIITWSDPTILGRVLECLSRVKILKISQTKLLRSEVPNIVSSGAFGRELTSLVFTSPRSTVPSFMPLISSSPNLRELTIEYRRVWRIAPKSLAPEHVWKREPLQSLKLFRLLREEIEYIARCGIMSHDLDLYLGDPMIEKVVACSSGIVEKLTLRGTWLLWDYTVWGVMLKNASDRTRTGGLIPFTPLPPLLALTTLEVILCTGILTSRLANFLSIVHSAPALSSVVFRDLHCYTTEDLPLSHVWIDVDNGLARLAMQVKTERSITVVLEGVAEENAELGEYFPEFRKTGGQIVMGKILRRL